MTLKEATDILTEAGIDSAEHDARELMRHIGGIKDTIILKSTDCSSAEFISAVEHRAKREPLQYIIGTVCFCHEEYSVTPDCLIPRPDTELLVEYAVKHIPSGKRFADLCSGCGCIGISTLCGTKGTECISVDISDGALALTVENAVRNGVTDRLTAVKCDLMKSTPPEAERLYAVLSNPPYIPRSVYEGLEKEIFHEPEIAFVGGDDGLDFYRMLIPRALQLTDPDGFSAFEIGYDQADAVARIAEDSGARTEIIKDYSGNDRVAVIKRK